GTWHSCAPGSTQDIIARQRNAPGRRTRRRTTGSELAGLGKCSRIEPDWVAFRADAAPPRRVLTRHQDSRAIGSGCSGVGTVKLHRLAALYGSAPNDTPASCDRIGDPALRHVASPFAERKFVSAAEVEYVSNVKVGRRIVTVDTKTRYRRGAIAITREPVKQVLRIRHDLGPSVGAEEIQALPESLLDGRLQTVIEAASVGGGVAAPFSEISERNGLRSTFGQDLGDIVGVGKHL